MRSLFCLLFLKGAAHSSKVHRISILKWRCLIWLKPLAIDACRVRAVEVGQRVCAANMLKGGMNARNRIGALHLAQVHLWLYAANIMIVATNQSTFAF